MPLIVIHGDDAVECLADGVNKQRVGWIGTGDLHSAFLKFPDCRLDDFFILASHVSVFPGMGIESGDRDARLFDVFRFRRFFDQSCDLHDPFLRDGCGYVFQSDMSRDENNAQIACGLHHRKPVRSAEFRHELRMPRKGDSRFIDGGFVDRTGYNRIRFATDDVLCRFYDSMIGKQAGFRRKFTGCQRGKRKRSCIDNVRGYFRREPFRRLADDLFRPVQADNRGGGESFVPENTHRDFRSDPGDVADGQSNDRSLHSDSEKL